MPTTSNLKYRILTTGFSEEKEVALDQLKKLWIETFGDSDAYVDLVYRTYLEKSIVVTCEKEDRVVSSLLAIPYRFVITPGEEETVGWYLCGLATIHELRGRGIMEKMMHLTEDEIKRLKGGFLFLIPADDRLATYYARKGYVSGAPRVEMRISLDGDGALKSGVNAIVDATGVYDLEPQERLKFTSSSQMNDTERAEVIGVMEASEREENGLAGATILHSKKDLETILKENEISGGTVVSGDDLRSVAIGYIIKEGGNGERGELEIRKIFGKTDDCYVTLKGLLSKYNLRVYSNARQRELIERIKKELVAEYRRDDGVRFGTALDPHCDATVQVDSNESRYIMVKGIWRSTKHVEGGRGNQNASKDEGLSESEISIFATNKAIDLKYPIFSEADKSVANCFFKVNPQNVSGDLLLD